MHGAFHLIVLLLKLCSGDEKAREEAQGCLGILLLCGVYGAVGMGINEAYEFWNPHGEMNMVLAMLTPAALLLGGVAIAATVRGARARERFEEAHFGVEPPGDPGPPIAPPADPPRLRERPLADLARREAALSDLLPPPTDPQHPHDLPRLDHLMEIDFTTERYFD